MGYAQYLQAKSCNIMPDVRMNPIVISITDNEVDFIVKGDIVHRGTFADYDTLLPLMKEALVESYLSLSKDYDIVIIEGAGSPVEINRHSEDISNIWLANYFQIPVILVGNMEYGGGFASLVGTFELLEHSFLPLVKGFVLNKYDGDIILLDKGIKYIENRYGKRFLGAMPYLKNLNLPEEDTLHFTGNPTTIDHQTDLELSDSFNKLAHCVSINIDLNFIYGKQEGEMTI